MLPLTLHLGATCTLTGMKVEILYLAGCPNHPPTVDLAGDVIRQLGINAEIEEVEVTGPDDAEQIGFLGSPTVLVDGVDVEPAAPSRRDFGFSCRRYGENGVPGAEIIRRALPDAGSGTGRQFRCN